MKPAKRNQILPILLALVTLGSTFVSCAKSADSSAPDAGTAAQTTEAETTSALSTIERKDFGGYEYRIISTNQDNRHVDVVAESETGSTLNDLVYRRNLVIEETFNVVISAKDSDFGSINSMTSEIQVHNPILYMTNSTAYCLRYPHLCHGTA